jgi:hypothetical protein
MEKEFIPYEQSLALKELGFNEPCICYATIEYKDVLHCGIGFKIYKETDLPTKPFGVPLYQQAFRWFREKYNLNSFVIDSMSYNWYFNINEILKDDVISEVLYFKTYEEAELACLKKLIEIVKNI